MARNTNTTPRVYSSWEKHPTDSNGTRKVFVVALTGKAARDILARRAGWNSAHSMLRYYLEWKGPLTIGAVIAGKWETDSFSAFL